MDEDARRLFMKRYWVALLVGGIFGLLTLLTAGWLGFRSFRKWYANRQHDRVRQDRLRRREEHLAQAEAELASLAGKSSIKIPAFSDTVYPDDSFTDMTMLSVANGQVPISDGEEDPAASESMVIDAPSPEDADETAHDVATAVDDPTDAPADPSDAAALEATSDPESAESDTGDPEAASDPEAAAKVDATDEATSPISPTRPMRSARPTSPTQGSETEEADGPVSLSRGRTRRPPRPTRRRARGRQSDEEPRARRPPRPKGRCVGRASRG